MAKKAKKKSTKDDGVKALIFAALKRAAASVEASMGDKSTKAEEGSYPVDLTVTIEGDITVGAAVPAGPLTRVPAFTDSEILAGLLASQRGPAARLALVAKGIAAAKEAKGEGKTKAIVEACGETVLKACKIAKATTRKGSAAKAGAVAGKPTVKVTGTQAARTLALEVDAA